MNRSHRLAYTIPIVLYFALAALYMFVIPPGESPDEPSHLQCIEQVTQYGRIPIVEPKPQGKNWWDRKHVISGMECYHMPLYYLQAGLVQLLTHRITDTLILYEFPPSNPDFPSSSAMFLHSTDAPLPNVREPIGLVVLRLESVLLGLVTLLATFSLTRQLTKDPMTTATAMTLVAGWPQFLFMSRAINNDVLATALAVAALAILCWTQRPRRFFWASLLSALAILTKLTMAFSALAIGVIFLIEWFSADPSQRRQYIKPTLGAGLAFVSLVLTVMLQPTIRSHLEASQATLQHMNPQILTLDYWLKVLDLTTKSGWGHFGWMNIATPYWQVLAWWLFIGGMSIVSIVRFQSSDGYSGQSRLTLTGIVWGTSFLIGYIRINLNRFQPQFRFILTLIPVFAAFAAAGLFSLLPPNYRAKRFTILLIAILLLAANVWINFKILFPLYS